MDIKTELKNLLQAAEVYRTQGLLEEAKEKYEKGLELTQESERIKNKQKIIESINKKILVIKKEIKELEEQPAQPVIPKEEQDLIKELFSEAKNKGKEEAVIAGAIALAKFGQFDRAIEELNTLLEKAAFRVDAAKNILRCHMARTSIDDAVIQYQDWKSGQIFSSGQLLTIRLFLEVYRYDDLKEKTPLELRTMEEAEELNIQDGIYPDICSMIVTLDEGPLEGGTFVLEVGFQEKNLITLFIDGHKEELLENFIIGKTLDNVQFKSTDAIYKGAGVVREKVKMGSGLREGDYRLDISIIHA